MSHRTWQGAKSMAATSAPWRSSQVLSSASARPCSPALRAGWHGGHAVKSGTRSSVLATCSALRRCGCIRRHPSAAPAAPASRPPRRLLHIAPLGAWPRARSPPERLAISACQGAELKVRCPAQRQATAAAGSGAVGTCERAPDTARRKAWTSIKCNMAIEMSGWLHEEGYSALKAQRNTSKAAQVKLASDKGNKCT